MKRNCLMIVAMLSALWIMAPANAQYIWLDKNNVKVYSDQPPPTSIPNNRILKSPRGGVSARNISDSTATDAASGATSSASPKQGPLTTAEKNAEYNKRKKEQAEKDKKAAEDKKRADEKAENCSRAKDYQRHLDSGQRVSRTNKDGEREYMGDDERAKESSKVNESLKDCN